MKQGPFSPDTTHSMLSMLGKQLRFLLIFSQETGFDNLHESQNLFSGRGRGDEMSKHFLGVRGDGGGGGWWGIGKQQRIV